MEKWLKEQILKCLYDCCTERFVEDTEDGIYVTDEDSNNCYKITIDVSD